MNFKHTDKKVSLIEDYYNHFDEDIRLQRRHGIVEFKTNMHYIHKILNGDTSKKILDVGAGTGAYSIALFDEGYNVEAVELVQKNIDVFRKKNDKIVINQANALDLSLYKNNSFDVVLLFGPMYHLLKEEEKIKALLEAKRITKDGGYIFVSYYMNEYAVINYGFMRGNILKSIEEGRLDESFHIVEKEDDLYSMARIEDIDRYNKSVELKRVKILASDGASDYIRTPINKLNNEEFEIYLKYHLSICERSDLLGASSHILDILQK